MSGAVSERKRLLRITAGNLRQNSIYLNGHRDFFPNGKIDAKNRDFDLLLVGPNETIRTGIRTSGRGSSKEHYFKGTEWIRKFFKYHKIRAGDVLAIERQSRLRYRLYPFETRSERDYDWRSETAKPLPGRGPTVLELFAGCGGMGLGFKQAGFRTVLAVEWDEAACETLRENVTKRVAQCAIQEIERFPEADVVAGGPPCQGFSNLGEKVPNDPRNQLWRHYMRAVEDARPEAFILENVPPLLKSQEYVEIKRIAESLGYEVEGRVLNSADYGVAQARKRAIVIGLRGAKPSFPNPTYVAPDQRLFSSDLPVWLTVKDRIGDLPPTPDGKDWHIGRNPTPMSIERYRCIPAGGNRWDLPEHLMPECWKKKVSGGTDLFGRLWWDRPSVTIRTEFYKPEKGRYLHPEEDRPITHREAARLQGFEDDFIFKGSKIKVGIQIGNAVPPPLAKAIAKHVRKLIRKRGKVSR